MLTRTMFKVEYSKSARKALKAMPRNVAEFIVEKIGTLAADPFSSNNKVRKLTSHPGYRLRVGDWRIAYLIYERALLIAVVRIAPRGEAYQ
ncbi:MAG: type II toxin-antitoxin system RelE/ParE family toxin [Syntrophales bacterium]|nr:type II toxin-antitoxin system RelE/ParE family toxin [Syntrophales bacterium]